MAAPRKGVAFPWGFHRDPLRHNPRGAYAVRRNIDFLRVLGEGPHDFQLGSTFRPKSLETPEFLWKYSWKATI